MEQFKNRLRELREEANISMQQLAEAIGVSNAAVCKWENGIAEPKVSYLVKLAAYFECTIDYLVCRTDDFNPSEPTVTPPVKLNGKEKEIVSSYRKLSPQMQKLFGETLQLWLNKE